MQCTTSVDVCTIRHEEDVVSCNAINSVEEIKDRSVTKILHSVKKTYQLRSKPRKITKKITQTKTRTIT